MANLKEIRGRITSIKSTMQITSAMKMVSAAKLKKAQDAIVMLRPYSEKLQNLIADVSTTLEPEEGSVYSVERPVKRVLYIVITSNRGLAGAFNTNVLKEFNAIPFAAGAEIEVLTIGKKAFDSIKKNRTIFDNKSEFFDVLTYENVANSVTYIMRRFREGNFDQVFVVYNKFINAATQEVILEQVLPITLDKKAPVVESSTNTDYIFEPGKNELLEQLIPKSVKTQIFKAILDSVAAEHGARMTAMHKATDNANALKNDLIIYYNKARQAAITNEILEIVSGAEALKS